MIIIVLGFQAKIQITTLLWFSIKGSIIKVRIEEENKGDFSCTILHKTNVRQYNNIHAYVKYIISLPNIVLINLVTRH